MVESLTHLGRSGDAARRRVLGEEVAHPRPATDNASLHGSTSNGSPSFYQVCYLRRKVGNLKIVEAHGFVEIRKNDN